MHGFLTIAVSVKIRMTIWVKRDSLSLEGWPNYKRAVREAEFGIACVKRWRIGTTGGT
jgi:hypothetical protein